MRIVRALILGLVFLAIFASVSLFFLGDMVHSGLEKAAPPLLGVSLTLRAVSLSPFSGVTRLSEVQLGNPPGFRQPSSLKLSSLEAVIAPQSLLAETIRIHSITVEGLELVWEDNRDGVNLLVIRRRLQEALARLGLQSGDDRTDTPATDNALAGPRLVIERLQFRGGYLRFYSGLLGGGGIRIALPELRLEGIGRQEGGVLAGEALRQVLDSLLQSVRERIRREGGLPEEFKARSRDLYRSHVDGAERLEDREREGLRRTGKKLREGWKRLRERLKR